MTTTAKNSKHRTLAEAILARREEMDHSQATAEAEMGLTMGTVSRWERGGLPGSAQRIEAAQEYLGMTRAAFAELILRTLEDADEGSSKIRRPGGRTGARGFRRT